MGNKIFNLIGGVCFFTIVIIVICSLVTDLGLWFEYSFPKVTSTTSAPIDTFSEPIQKNLDKKEYVKVNGEKKKFVLNLQAEYTLAGVVVAKNTNFWFRDIMRNDFDDICLVDLGIVWGDLSKDPKLLHKHWKIKSKKTLGEARRLSWYTKDLRKSPWSLSYVSSHISHSHLIPATANVMRALSSVKTGDTVKLDGYLVDIYTDKTKLVAKTSLSRTDTDPTSRGSGACEVMYVKQVQIGNKIYR